VSIELRNAIYEYYLDDFEVFIKLKPDDPESEPWGREAPSRALTQSCRQLRNDFLPLFESTSSMLVLLVEVEAFVDTWLNAPDGTLHATLMIDSRRCLQRKSRIDLMPLIKLRRQYPKFAFFVNDVVETVPDTPPRMARRDDVRYIADAILMINFHLSCVSFHIKPELAGEWGVRENAFDEDITDCAPEKLWDLKRWVHEFFDGSSTILVVCSGL
jgi:hypothetical protein